jgi:CheY-like chemotaxis protein
MKFSYVEDNDDNVYMLKSRLTRAGFTVVIATNGGKGIAIATSAQPTSFSSTSLFPITTAKRRHAGST